MDIQLKGIEQFSQYAENIKPNDPPVFFYFTGEKLPSGISWCPDCVEAEPIVKSFLTEVKVPITFVYVDVGDRDAWKDRNCPFRTDPRTKLMVIPTLMKWKGVQRLEGSQCSKIDLLRMLIEEEEE